MSIGDLEDELVAQRLVANVMACGYPYAISSNLLDPTQLDGLPQSDGAFNAHWSTTWAGRFPSNGREFLRLRAGYVYEDNHELWRRVAIIFLKGKPPGIDGLLLPIINQPHVALAWPWPDRPGYNYVALTEEQLEKFCADFPANRHPAR